MKKIITITPSAYSAKAMGDINNYIEYYKNDFKVVVISDLYKEDEVIIDDVYYVKNNTRRAQYYIFVSEYKIDAGSLSRGQKISNKQKWVSVWHGIPYKKMFVDFDKKELSNTLNYSSAYDVMISPSKWYTKNFLTDSMLYKKDVIELGSSRCDNLFLSDTEKNKIKKELGIEKNKKVVLYAPTFREKGTIKQLEFNPSKLLNNLGDDYVLVVKLHYLNNLSVSSEKIIDATSYQNVNNILSITDLLITDYSSLFFDYSVLSEKTIFFQYDKENYMQDRGVNFELTDYVDKKWICETKEELYEIVSQVGKIKNNIKENFYPLSNGEDTKRIVDKLNFDPTPRKFEEVIFLVNNVNNIGGVATFIKNLSKVFKERYNSKIIVVGIKEFLFSYDNIEYLDDTYIDIMISSEKVPTACKVILEETNGLIISTQFSAQMHFQKHLKNKNNVLMFHGDVKDVISKSELYNWHMDALNSNSIYNYKSLALLTKSNEELFAKNYNKKDKITHIYNPYDATIKNLYKKSGIFVAITRLDEDKNVFDYIKIFEDQNLNPEFKLEIYGDGKLREQLQQTIVDKKLEKRIKLMGYCSDKEKMFKNKQGLIFTPISEGYPYTILESYSYCVPVYSYDSFTAVTDMINDKVGKIIKFGDIENFVEVLNYSTDLRKEIDFKNALSDSSSDSVVKSWIELYDKIQKTDSVVGKKFNFSIKATTKKIIENQYRKMPIMFKVKVREIRQYIEDIVNVRSIKKIEDDQPLVSIIVPFYNNGDTIKATLDSIKKQKYKNIEVVLVNDGSEYDEKPLLKKYDNIRYFKKENEGLGFTRNYGIKNAIGKYLIYLDSDDCLVNGAISSLVLYSLKHKVDLVIGKKIRVDYNNKSNREVWMDGIYKNTYVNKKDQRYLLLSETTSTGILYNREKLLESKIEFVKGLYEDKPYIARVFSHFENIGVLNKHIYYWYIYGTNTSITTSIDIDNFRQRVKKINEIFENSNNIIKFHYYSFVINHDFRIYINKYCMFSEKDKKEIFSTYKNHVTKYKEFYYHRNVSQIINRDIAESAINNDYKRFDKIAELHSSYEMEKDD